MPVAQVVLLDWVKVYDELSDDQFKWFFCRSLAEVGDLAEREERRLRGTLDSRVEIIPFAEWRVSAHSGRQECRNSLPVGHSRCCESSRAHASLCRRA